MDLEAKEKQAFLKKFGHHVEFLINKKFESKAEFMRQTGFLKKSLHEILMGNRDTRIFTANKLAKALGISLKKLFEGMEKD